VSFPHGRRVASSAVGLSQSISLARLAGLKLNLRQAAADGGTITSNHADWLQAVPGKGFGFGIEWKAAGGRAVTEFGIGCL